MKIITIKILLRFALILQKIRWIVPLKSYQLADSSFRLFIRHFIKFSDMFEIFGSDPELFTESGSGSLKKSELDPDPEKIITDHNTALM